MHKTNILGRELMGGNGETNNELCSINSYASQVIVMIRTMSPASTALILKSLRKLHTLLH